MPKRKIGRDAASGKFITVEEAKRRPKTTVIETIDVPEPPPPPAQPPRKKD